MLTPAQALRSHPTLLLKGPQGSARISIPQIFKDLGASDDELGQALSNDHPDAFFIDGRITNKAEFMEIRSLCSLHPAIWSYRYLTVIYLDEVHPSVLQSLLKLIEEPPATLRVVLSANSTAKIPSTVVSRAIHLDLAPLSKEDLEEIYREEGLDAPSFRARVAGGDADIGRELDSSLVKTWDLIWQDPDMTFSIIQAWEWTEWLTHASIATKMACWETALQAIVPKLMGAHKQQWAAIAFELMENKKRSKETIRLSTSMVRIWGCMRAIKRQISYA